MRKASLLLALFGFISLAWPSDPFVGTWRLNLARSKYNPASSAPKSGTIKTEATVTGYRSVGDGVDSNGKETHWESARILDGKPHPVTGNADYIYVATRVDAHTIVGIVRSKGKEISTERSVISKDGKTLTVTAMQRNSKGEAVTNIMVFDKH